MITIKTINEALRLLEYKGIDMICYSCGTAIDTDATMLNVNGTLAFNAQTRRIELTMVTVISPVRYEIEYSIGLDDLGDQSSVNKFTGDLSKFDDDTRQMLRLAWILGNGYKFATERAQSCTRDGWQPRVVAFRKGLYC